MLDEKLASVGTETIGYFRSKFIPRETEILYEVIDEETIKMKVPKDLYNSMTASLKSENQDFSINPQERKMELRYPYYKNKKLLKTKHFNFNIFFVDPAALKPRESLEDIKNLNIKDWADFFETIDPEYRNIFKKIVDGVSIAVHKNEYNKVISKKTYFLNLKDGLYEKKEKLIGEEWVISYQPVTQNVNQLFRMFFKYFEQATINELADFDKFKEIVSASKFRNFVQP